MKRSTQLAKQVCSPPLSVLLLVGPGTHFFQQVSVRSCEPVHAFHSSASQFGPQRKLPGERYKEARNMEVARTRIFVESYAAGSVLFAVRC